MEYTTNTLKLWSLTQPPSCLPCSQSAVSWVNLRRMEEISGETSAQEYRINPQQTYRGIALLSTCFKVLVKAVEKHLSSATLHKTIKFPSNSSPHIQNCFMVLHHKVQHRLLVDYALPLKYTLLYLWPSKLVFFVFL